MNGLLEIQAEKELLREATKVLNSLTGSKIIEIPLPKEDSEPDALITIKFAPIQHRFNVLLKGELRQNQAIGIIEKFGKNKDQWLLVARYIPRPLKDYLKGLGINYLELAGNSFINVEGIFIYIADQKVTALREVAIGKLWKPTGLKFLMVIINNPELLEASYREIASAAGIALGSIGPLLAELRSGGYAFYKRNKLNLDNREKLITRWIEMFHAAFRPKLIKGNFRFLRAEAAKEWKNANYPGIFWGGEPGAALITGHLVPENFTIFTDKSGIELVKMLGIVSDKNGNVTILEKFWGEPSRNKKVIKYRDKASPAPALLIYADLINDLDSRNREIAERIKEEYLNGK